MKKIISLFLCFCLLLVVLDVPVASRAEDLQSTGVFTYDNIPARWAEYNSTTLKYHVGGYIYTYTLPEYNTIQKCGFDAYGTLWVQAMIALYYISYEGTLESEIDTSSMYLAGLGASVSLIDDSNSIYYSQMKNKAYEIVELPSYDTILYWIKNESAKSSLNQSEDPKVDPDYEEITPPPTPAPTPTVSPTEKPTDTPTVTPTVAPGNTPVPSSPTETPDTTIDTGVTADATPAPTESPATNTTIKKVTTSGNKISLIGTSGESISTVTFKEKKSKLVYNDLIEKNVVTVAFTKKGSLVFLKKNGNLYYFKDEKKKKLDSGVTAVTLNKNNFATKYKKKKKLYLFKI